MSAIRCAALKDGKLDCYYGDDRWLTRTLKETGLASAYGYATVACGFRMLRHEGKLTGLAAYGEPKLADEMAAQFRFNNDRRADRDGFPQLVRDAREVSRRSARATTARPSRPRSRRWRKISPLQSVRWWLGRTGARKLALAGGLFANVRLNRLLAETLPLDEVFVFPAMGDEGLSVGAALTFLHARDGTETWLRHRRRLDNIYLGQNYDGRIDDTLASAGMRRLAGPPVETAVDLIRAGKAGAIYTGRMEFGPRALGARSIIASPHDHAINDLLNKRLDRSRIHAVRALCAGGGRGARVRDHRRQPLRGALHDHHLRRAARMARAHSGRGACRRHRAAADRARRGQPAVRRDPAPLPRPTELPVLINTSFNVHEEPIVNRPEECLQALSDGRVDFVVTQQAVYVKG